MAEPSELLTLAERYRRAVLAREQEALRPMIRAYGAAYTRLQTQLEALLLAMKDMPQPIKLATLNREVRYRELMAQIEDELRRFGPLADEMLQQLVEDSAALGLEAGAATLRAAGVRGSFNLLPARAMETLSGFLQPETPLSAYLVSDQMLPGMLQQVTDALMMGMARGQNPRVIGSAMRQAFGKGLTSAVRTARTVNLWAYREANRAQWQASGVVEKWVWHAHLGKRTCASCINMHGTVHEITEPLNDHWNGRCAAVPITEDMKEWAASQENTGRKWFAGLDAKTQQEHFGDPNVYKAWKTGKIRWDDLTREKPDKAFGQMRQMPSAKELGVGAKPKGKADKAQITKRSSMPDFPPAGETRWQLVTEAELEQKNEESEKWVAQLSEDEYSAMSSWTGGGWKNITKNLGSNIRTDKENAFLSALEKAPRHKGISWRGINAESIMETQEKMRERFSRSVGSIIEFENPASTSLMPDVAESFGKTIFEIKGNSGRYINAASPYYKNKKALLSTPESDEFEVLFRPHTRFRVIRVDPEATVETIFRTEKVFLVQLEEVGE